MLSRRHALGLAGATLLPRIAIAQGDTRPSITIAVQKIATSATLETLREQSNVGTRIFSSFFETMIGVDWTGGLGRTGRLATEWHRLDDRTLELNLRPGVRFHNGALLTAEDVAFSFGNERMWSGSKVGAAGMFVSTTAGAASKLPPPEAAAIARAAYPGFERIEIVNANTVRFINATPDVTLEARLTRNTGVIVSQKGFAEAASWLDWARKPVGTGPYKVREIRPDSMLILDAHDEYWEGRPPIKTLRLVEVPEVSSRINGLLSGEFQFACDIPPDQILDIEKNAAFRVQGGTIPNHRILAFDKNNGLANPKLRLALAHAIDRKAIVDSLWAGRTTVPAGLQWPFYADMLVQGWTVPEYDPARVKQLLAEANYKGERIEFRLQNNYYTNQTATGQALTEMFNQVGINVQIVMKENWSQVFEKTPSRAVRDWSNSATFNDPVSSIVAQHGPNGEQQQRGEWTNAEMNELSAKMQTSTDRAARKQMFARMLMICEREDPAYTVLHQNATFTATRKDIGWKAAPSFAMDFRAKNRKA